MCFLSATKIESQINSLEDLADQDEMQYGVLQSGTTFEFFKEATIPLYKKMYKTMTSKSSFGKTTTKAVERVRKGNVGDFHLKCVSRQRLYIGELVLCSS